MKTFLKRFGFLAVLAIMFNAEVVGQKVSAFVGPGIYAIVNDTTLISTFAPNTWFTNARVSGIVGDEIKFVYLDADSLMVEGYWNISDSLSPNDDVAMTEYTYFFISTIGDVPVPQINFNSVDETINGVFFFCPTKYSPYPLIIGNGEAKSDIFIGDELFISDFGIYMDSPISNGLSYPVVDSIYWYVDETYCGITYDTISSLTTEYAGTYYINLYITYTNDKNGVTASYHRNIISNTITVNSIIIANDDSGSANVNNSIGQLNVLNVFNNDWLNGNPINPDNVTLTVPEPNEYLTLNLDGSVDIAAGTPAGDYSFTYQICEVLNPTNCDDATVTISVDNPTEINLLSSNEKLTIYPNPAIDILTISEEVKYSVYSYSGQEILRGFGKEIDVTKLSVGTYILKTDKGDSKFTVVQ